MKAIYLLALLYAGNLNAEELTHTQKIELKAQKIVKGFATELKSTLKAGIKNGGLEAGIDICKNKAPQIAKKYSLEGWEVGRTSLKVRNQANNPSDKELAVLQSFNSRLAKGEDVRKLTYSNYNPDTKQYHFMKAIPTGQLCLTCHGKKIDAKLSAKINKLYPSDQAKGYKLGDIRGAFSITYKNIIER